MEPAKNVCAGIVDTEIGAPPGHENEILPLPAAIGLHHTGMPMIISRWALTPEERQAIYDGADIYLHVFSRQMVPVMLTTEAPVVVPIFEAEHNVPRPIILTPDHPQYYRYAPQSAIPSAPDAGPPGPPSPPRPPFHRVG